MPRNPCHCSVASLQSSKERKSRENTGIEYIDDHLKAKINLHVVYREEQNLY